MAELQTSFAAGFAELTDVPAPYPWQQKLFEAMVTGNPPAALDVPTGLGKTSAIPIWLLACLLAPPEHRQPMRLVYVVNRRTIVDQATDVAENLWRRIGDSPQLQNLWKARFGSGALAVSTLRGAKADNGQWLLAPHQPAIIIGTVDMIGSRLLFNAYRAGCWQRSRHAGLLGQDALLVHDEAHLSRPFQKLIEWLALRQQSGSRRLLLLPMSATAAASGQALGIGAEDRRIASGKLKAVKELRLHAPEDNVAAQLAQLAAKHEVSAQRVIIFVRLPETAKAVRRQLEKLTKADQSRIELLTGTIRGHERDQLVGRPVPRHLLKGWEDDPPRTEYLVATSAGEVGADFDADQMVCDLSTLEAMVQRLGRVNRRGGQGRKAQIDVVLDKPAAKKKDGTAHDQARLACAGFLEALAAQEQGVIDASPEAITGNPEEVRAGWRDRNGYVEACEPEVPTVSPHDATLDAWSLTSIQEDWPLAQEVHPYLHGLDEEAPQTFLAWRAELDELEVRGEEEIDATPVRQVLEHYPLRPQELLHDRPDVVAKLLLTLRQRNPDKLVVTIAGRTLQVRRLRELTDDSKRLTGQLGYHTVILPASVGGLDAGMVATEATAPVADVADRQEDRRARVLLRRDDNGHWHGRRLAGGPGDGVTEPPHEPSDRWTEARDAWAGRLDMRYAARVVLSEDAAGVQRQLLLFRQHPQRMRPGPPLALDDHHGDVQRMVQSRIDALGLAADTPTARALIFAAAHHDLGKAWDSAEGCWQTAIANPDRGLSYAKSLGKGMNSRLLAGYRHEFGSLLRAAQSPELAAMDEATRDLALHLIAAHHGRGRPGFTAAAMRTALQDLPPCIQPAEMARRFDRLQRRYGHWGLAWLESILMSADAEASQGRSAAAAEDEEEEDVP